MILEPEMGRSIQPTLDENLVPGANNHRLFRQDLEEGVVEAESEIVAHNAVMVKGEDPVEVVAFEHRPVSVRGIGRGDGAAAVMIGNISVPEEPIGLFDGGDAAQPKLFDQAVLMGSESPLDTTFRLRAVGLDDFDIELRHGPAELSERILPVELLIYAHRPVDDIHRVFVDVEGTRPATPLDIGAGSGHEVQRVFNRDKLAMKNAAGGVVDVDDQDAARAATFEPVVIGAVELY